MPRVTAPALTSACTRLALLAGMTALSCTGGYIVDGGAHDGSGAVDAGQVDGGEVVGGDDAGFGTGLHACGAPGTGEAMDFVAAGGQAVYLVRVLVGQGVGNSGIYEPLVFAYDDGVDVVCVSDVAAQSYENTHHNHYDVYAVTSAGVRYEFAWGFAQVGAEWLNSYTLTLVDVSTEAAIGEPIDLHPL